MSSLVPKSFMNWAAKTYQRSLAGELNKMGLRWEDLVISETPEMKEVLELADKDVVKGRLRRLLRASDLTYKGKVYTDYADASNLEPFKLELWEDLKKIEAREEEYALLDLHKK